MRFTDLLIKNLQPQADRYDVREARGFSIRVFPSGEKSWQFIYTFHGRKRRMGLGAYPAMSLMEAHGSHAEAVKLLAKGIDPAVWRQEQRDAAALAVEEDRRAPPVESFAGEYIERWAKPHKRSWKEDRRMLKADVLPAWGKRKMASIHRRDVITLLDAIAGRGAPIAANRTLALLRRMFNFAVERGVIEHSPAFHVKAPAPENRRDRVLSDDEIRCVWLGLSRAPFSVYIREALKLMLLTGSRKAEVVAMEWNEIEGTWWTLPAEKAKNGEIHRVPLSPQAIGIIEQLKAISASSRWVFPGLKEHITGWAVDHAVLRWLRLIEKEPWTPHDLRRTVGTRLGELGFNRLVQDKVLNHKDRTVGGIYDRHSYDREKRQALEAWGRRLEAIVEGTPSGVVVALGGGR